MSMSVGILELLAIGAVLAIILVFAGRSGGG